MNKLISKTQNFLASESGATSVEYAVMLMLLVGVCLAGITAVGDETGAAWASNSAKIDAAVK